MFINDYTRLKTGRIKNRDYTCNVNFSKRF